MTIQSLTTSFIANVKNKMDSSRLLIINPRKYIPTIDCISQINAPFMPLICHIGKKKRNKEKDKEIRGNKGRWHLFHLSQPYLCSIIHAF
jgi:hypothetical protein